MNPFLLTGYESPEYFCDRVEETKTLLNNLNNRSNTTFFAPRRTGKTALIQHVFHTLKKKKQVCIYKIFVLLVTCNNKNKLFS